MFARPCRGQSIAIGTSEWGPESAPPLSSDEQIISNPVEAFGCDPRYRDVAIPPAPLDLDCGDIAHRRFTVLPHNPHSFDEDVDRSGCERG